MTQLDANGEKLRLRDRLPDYVAVFAAGLAVAVAIGVAIGVLTAAGVVPAVGYAVALFGVVWLLAGGMSGGGYSVLGIGKGAGRYSYAVGDGNDALLEELRQGYLPRADPVAFWQVVGGVLYLGIGVAVLTIGS